MRCGAVAVVALLALSTTLCRAEDAADAKAAENTAQEAEPKRVWNITRSDMVAAFPADEAHMDVARASRIWRKGLIRSYIALDNPPSDEIVAEGLLHNETWSYYPDDRPRRSLYAGDTRAALVPFLAHAHFGDSYLWLLYMDDDTVFVPAAVIRLLRDMDPDQPYFVTDHLWFSDELGSRHPNGRAPRCLLCGYQDPQGRAPLPGSSPAPPGCPCTPAVLCATTPHLFNAYCDMPRHPENTYSMHGGAGGILSHALLKAVGLDYVERCVLALQSTGGDAFISVCLWQAGYGFTDPGRSVYEDVRHFDPGSEDRLGAMRNLAAYIDGHWEGVPPARAWVTTCDQRCELELEALVSLHARSRAFPTLDDAASFIRAFVGLHETYEALRERREQREHLERRARNETEAIDQHAQYESRMRAQVEAHALPQ